MVSGQFPKVHSSLQGYLLKIYEAADIMSQPNSAGEHPTSFNTNVNRAKTKKWVEAKSYSYDGDDWGDVDDYDEYGGYDEPEPAPKPTGLRQRGQSSTQAPQEGYGARQDLYQSQLDARRPHGQMGGAAPQQQYGGRSVTNPPPQNQSPMVRKNSFDQGDERRAFSAGGVQPGMTSTARINPALQPQGQNIATQDFQPVPMHPNQQAPAQPSPGRPGLQIPNRSSMEGQARYAEQAQSAVGTFRGPAYLDQQGQGSRTHSMTSNTSQDFHNRRDFSPSAMPPPLQTRGSPSPHGDPDSRSSSRHPPRKSSLSQDNPPTLPFPTQAPPVTMARDPEDDLPATRDRAGSGASKPLPFVRPADIYKRMQEEKEKERQSQESSRPSMDSIIGKPNERTTLGKTQDNESAQRSKPTLDPVSERKSEYGMEGINVNDPAEVGERRPTTSKKFELPKRALDTGSQSSTGSLGPILPDVSRVSGFGESFFGSGDSFTTPTLNFTGSSSRTSQEPRQIAPEKDLQHQPSLGFTSAVHHAFDKAEDQVPPTPSSTAASTIGRSTSGGTSAVSPIISRGPSAATDRLPGIEDVSTSTIAEEPEGSGSRPRSSGSPVTPRQFVRKPSPSQGMAPESVQPRDDPPPLFIPGHRRDLSTPSPDNSPARTPALEANRQLRQPQEVELAATTPTDQGFSTGSSSQNSAIDQEEGPALSRDSYGCNKDMQPASTNLPGKADQKVSPISSQYTRNRTDSSSSSRVRNLADRFESGSRPGSAHSTTPRASLLSSTTQKKDDLAPPRPVSDRMESFRPHLPGGWESSASIAPATGARGLETVGGRQQLEEVDISTTSGPSLTRLSNRPNEDMATPSPDHDTSSVSQIKDASAEAFTAAAAAGTALAGAFAAAVGTDQHDLSTESPSDGQGPQRKSEDRGPKTRDRNPSINTVVHPEASRPSFPSLTDDEISSAAPTPLPSNMQRKPAVDAEDPEYFPSPLSVHQGSSKRASQIEGSTTGEQQPTLPLLSTDLQSQQYESDRLRKEIVRELTPMSASEPMTAETDYSNYQALSTNPSVIRPGHESGVIPREYDSYWNDENSEDEVSEISRDPTRLEHAATTERQQGASLVSEPLPPSEPIQPAPLAPVPQDEPPQGRPHMLPPRFSWERPLHDLSTDPKPLQEPTAAPTSDFLKSAIYPAGRSFQPRDGPSEIDHTSTTPVGPSSLSIEPPRPLEKDLPILGSTDLAGQQTEPIDTLKEIPDFPSGLEVTQSKGERVSEEPSISSHNENMSNLDPRSSIGEIGEREVPDIPLSEPLRSDNLTYTAPEPYLPSTGPPFPPKIPAFREIVALKTPSDRIRGYNDARQQFAGLKVGLDDWVAQTVYELPEHADLLTMSGRPTPNFQGHRPSPSSSKLGGLLPSGGQGGQQPYYQQYANASPQSSGPTGSLQGGAAGGVSPQAYSPSGGSGGKISSQQVQAKGKDLLHTAGVFGGKANVAAKGLFSKGKSKFRAASGAEKV